MKKIILPYFYTLYNNAVLCGILCSLGLFSSLLGRMDLACVAITIAFPLGGYILLKSFKFRFELYLLGFYLLVTFVSSVHANVPISLNAALAEWVAIHITIYLCCFCIRYPKLNRVILSIIIIAGFVYAIHYLIQYWQVIDRFYNMGLNGEFELYRSFFVPFGKNHNIVSTLFVFLLYYSFFMYCNTKRRLFIFFYSFAVTLFILSILIGLSKGLIIPSLLGFIIIAIWLGNNFQHTRKRILILAIVCVTVGCISILIYPKVFSTIKSRINIKSNYMNYSGMEYRKKLWRSILKNSNNYSVCGSGIATYENQTPDVTDWSADMVRTKYTFNLFIRILIERGVFGCAIFLTLIFI